MVNISKFLVYMIFMSLLMCCKSSTIFGTYKNINNSGINNSQIIISDKYFTYAASTDMLGSILQKENYILRNDTLIVNFKKPLLKSTSVTTNFDKNLNASKLRLRLAENEAESPIVNLIINDSLKYQSKKIDTLLNIKYINKIVIKDTGLKFINDTIININKNHNIVDIKLSSKTETPVLNMVGEEKFLVKKNELYRLNSKSSKKEVFAKD